MDGGFEERKKRHEEKWVHDEGLKFKAAARRNKLLGRWAAAELGLTGQAADGYAGAVVAAEIHGPDHAFLKVQKDFADAGLPHTAEQLSAKLVELSALAYEQVLNGPG